MQNVRTAQREISRRRHAAAAQRWLVLLLVLALATSGLLHALGGDHDVAVATYSQEVASVSHDACGDPCCQGHSGQIHATTCSMASGCSLCVPLAGSAVLALVDAEPALFLPEAVHPGRIQSPHIRPPKLSQNA